MIKTKNINFLRNLPPESFLNTQVFHVVVFRYLFILWGFRYLYYMRELIKKILREHFLLEMFDSPIKYKEIYDGEYLIYDNKDIEAKMIFKIELNPEKFKYFELPDYKLKLSDSKKYYEVEWGFSHKMIKNDKNTESWVKITSTVPFVLKDYLSKHNVDMVRFSGKDSRMGRIYSYDNFTELLLKHIPSNYTIINTENNNIVVLKKEIYNE